MMRRVWVPGVPRTKGSVDVQHGAQGGRAYRVVNASKDEPAWAALVALAVRQRMSAAPPEEGPVFVWADFWVPWSDAITMRAGDLDKMLRSVFDAMTKGGAWGDDRQAVLVLASKREALSWLGPGVLLKWMPTKVDDLAAQEAAQVRDGLLD
jgi:Holliday junction resolvase RusA-like endonuclease